MTQIGLMIEGQDGLNWDRWKKLLQAAEDFGYQCLFRSDHFTNAGPPDKDSLEMWISLTYAATYTSRIEFGPLVSPTTFRNPAMNARMAAQVDDLSGGRLIFGMGAGWQEREHRKFGIPFYDVPTRHAMLEEALELTTRLFHSDKPVSFQGQHFSLDEAVLLPRPQRKGGPPILIGGNGLKRTLPLVAKYATEWNAVLIDAAGFKERTTRLDSLLEANGCKLGEVKRSLMTGCYFARSEEDMQAILKRMSERVGREITFEGMRERGIIIGTSSMMIDQMGEFVEAGVERFMLQWLDQDDIAGIERVARDVLPHFHN